MKIEWVSGDTIITVLSNLAATKLLIIKLNHVAVYSMAKIKVAHVMVVKITTRRSYI